MQEKLVHPQRNSFIAIGEIYFWTATINSWHQLLLEEDYKQIIINSLDYLSKKAKIDVFAFVIMPNHIHLIWRTKEYNGKESAHASFLKFTAHQFKKNLLNKNPEDLNKYRVNAINKNYEFWQRDSLAIPLLTKNVALQKLDYIHNNPLSERWNLVKDPCDYIYSSARYYEQDLKNYNFLKDLLEEL